MLKKIKKIIKKKTKMKKSENSQTSEKNIIDNFNILFSSKSSITILFSSITTKFFQKSRIFIDVIKSSKILKKFNVDQKEFTK